MTTTTKDTVNDPDTKTCRNPACRAQFRRRVGFENRADFGTRKYCSIACARQPRAAGATEPKTCETCGKTFTWQPGMSTKGWRARRYCSRECSGAPLHKPPTTDVLPVIPDVGSSRWRDRAACQSASDPTWFDPSDLWSEQVAAEIETTALAFCANCPALLECGAEADQLRLLGLYGGVYRARRQGRYWWRRFVPAAREPRLRDRRRVAS